MGTFRATHVLRPKSSHDPRALGSSIEGVLRALRPGYGSMGVSGSLRALRPSRLTVQELSGRYIDSLRALRISAQVEELLGRSTSRSKSSSARELFGRNTCTVWGAFRAGVVDAPPHPRSCSRARVLPRCPGRTVFVTSSASSRRPRYEARL